MKGKKRTIEVEVPDDFKGIEGAEYYVGKEQESTQGGFYWVYRLYAKVTNKETGEVSHEYLSEYPY